MNFRVRCRATLRIHAHKVSNRYMPDTRQPAPAERPALTTRQVADHIGVSMQTVRRWRAEGSLSGRQVGHEIHFARTEVDRFCIGRFGYLASVL